MKKLCFCGWSSKFAIFENANFQKPTQKKHPPTFTMHEPLAAGNAYGMRSMDRLQNSKLRSVVETLGTSAATIGCRLSRSWKYGIQYNFTLAVSARLMPVTASPAREEHP